MKEHRVNKISWRRKYFSNEKSWRLYCYAVQIGMQANGYLRQGSPLRDHKSRIISDSNRFVFTKNREPFFGIGNRWYLKVEHTPRGLVVLETRKEIENKFKKFHWLSPLKGKGFVRMRIKK